MRYVLVGVLVAAAVGAGRAEAAAVPPRLVGLDHGGVMAALGQPTIQLSSGKGWAIWYCERVDCLGGRFSCSIGFWQGAVTDCKSEYRLFADRPPWLEQVWRAFSPRPAP